jgi:3-hydroxyacyl-[acyl-carrier-protein] dehydratase
LRIEVDVLAFKSRMGRMEAKALVDGKLACQATLTCQIVPACARSAPPLPISSPQSPRRRKR